MIDDQRRVARTARQARRGRHRPGRRAKPERGRSRRPGSKTISWHHVFPLMTPLAIDPAHPFPFIPNLGFGHRPAAGAHQGRAGDERADPPAEQASNASSACREEATATRAADLDGRRHRLFIGKLFPGYAVKGRRRIPRHPRLSKSKSEEEAEDLVGCSRPRCKRRRRGNVIRLDIEADACRSELRASSQQALDAIRRQRVQVVDGVLALDEMSQIVGLERPDLEFVPFTPRYPDRVRDIRRRLFRRDPAEGSHRPSSLRNPSTWWCNSCSRRRATPTCVAIKQTLYRTSANSPIVKALVEAAEAGKSVTALVELKARFDEEANIRWARDSGTRRRAGRVRLHRTQDPRQAVAGGAREGTALASYVPCRHRQLSPGHRAHLYRSVVLHRRSRRSRATSPGSSISSPAMPSPRELERMAVSPLSCASASSSISSRKSRTPRPAAGGHLGEDEFAGRSRKSSTRSMRRSSAGRGDRTGGARHLLPAAWRPGPVREYPGQVDHRALPRTWAHLLLRLRPRAAASPRPRSTSPRPT